MLLGSLLAEPAAASLKNNPTVFDLVVGQNRDIGDIKVWDDGVSLYISFETDSTWCLQETKLAVASSLSEIPQQNGKLVPKQFPYQRNHNCATSFQYVVPLHDVCECYVVAHAMVKGAGASEAAWGNGFNIYDENHISYFHYKSRKCRKPPTPKPTRTSTTTVTPTPTPITTLTATPTLTPTTTLTATFTATNTVSPTATPTINLCESSIVVADFSKVAAGESVEGMGVVAPNLNIDAKGTAIKIAEGQEPFLYKSKGAPINAGIDSNGGFGDLITQIPRQPHQYTFTFAPGISINYFSLRMLDFGDINPSLNTNHYASMTAYDAEDDIVFKQELVYNSSGEMVPKSSDRYGNLSLSGDALAAFPGQPGNWTWYVFGNGIVKVVLDFGNGFDPNIGFDTLSFIKKCP
jgi:hypothetical protein